MRFHGRTYLSLEDKMMPVLKRILIILLLSVWIIPASAEISWLTDYYDAKNLGELHNKPIVVYFYYPECSHCIQMEDTFKDPLILARQNDFIWVRVDVNDIKNHNLRQEYGLKYAPTTYFLYPNGTSITYIDVYMNATRFRKAVDFAYAKAKNMEYSPPAPTPATRAMSSVDILAAAFSIILAVMVIKTLSHRRRN